MLERKHKGITEPNVNHELISTKDGEASWSESYCTQYDNITASKGPSILSLFDRTMFYLTFV